MRTIEELKEKIRVELARHRFSTKDTTNRYRRGKITPDWFKNWATMVKEKVE